MVGSTADMRLEEEETCDCVSLEIDDKNPTEMPDIEREQAIKCC